MTKPATGNSATNLFELYFEYVKDTESPLVFHRWSLITSISAFLGRKFWLSHGTSRIFPTSYVMLVGNPGTRKSSAIKTCKKILSHAGYANFSAEKTTKEKFLLDLEGLPESFGADYGNRPQQQRGRAVAGSKVITPQDVLASLDLGTDTESHDGIPREVFICADEFNEFAGSGNLDFLSLLGSLWDWDDELATYRHRLKNSKSLSIYQPTVTILGGNTHTGFQEAFPVAALGQGFLSRLLLVHGEPSGRKIAFPTKPEDGLRDKLQAFVREIGERVQGEATLSTPARNALAMIYATWKDLDDFRFKSYSTRRFTHLLKLVLIVTAMRLSTNIEEQDVLLANTILTFTENNMPKALGEFGKSRNSEAAQNVMSALYDAKSPLTFEQLWKVVSRDLDKREQLTDIVRGLAEAGKIQMPEKGSAKAGFLPAQKPVNTKALYVDFNLLQEMKGRI
jgi:hypothetical protein